MSFFAARMSRFKQSASQIASARARELREQGRDIIALTAGEPDFPTPDNIKQAAWEAMQRNETKYTNVRGTIELRRAVSDKFRRENGLEYDPATQIIISSGAKQTIFNALMSTVEKGDEVIIPAPYWTSYPDMVQLAGGTPVPIVCGQNNRFKMRAEQLEEAITERSKWLILTSPNNPTGAAYTKEELIEIAEVLARHPNVHVLTDDIYEHLVYDGFEFTTIAQVAPSLYDRTVTVNGVSKAYAMTGWRIGYAGGPSKIIGEMAKMQSQSTSGPSSIGQAAALEALTGPQEILKERGADLERRRDLMVELVNACEGLACHKPEGAMYVYASCAGVIGKKAPDGKIIETDEDVTMYLLETAEVAVVQGGAYGLSPYIRISFVSSDEELKEAGQRMKEALAKLD